MDGLREWWRKQETRRRILLIINAVIAAWFLAWVVQQPWAGFVPYSGPIGDPERGKTLWDLLELLIVPIVLAAGVLWFNSRTQRRELEVAEDNQQEEAMQTYLTRMSELLLKHNLKGLVPETSDNTGQKEAARDVARTLTLTVLARLNPERKTAVMRFLEESDLIAERVVESVDGEEVTHKPPIIHLSRAHLQGSTMAFAKLKGAHLDHVNLEGADLTAAHLEGANLRVAHLEGATLRAAYLQGANLRFAHLEGATLEIASLVGADLSGAHLEGATLITAHLVGADLSGAHLEGATLRFARLEEATLADANLEGSDLSGAHLEGADLSGAHLEGAIIAVLQGTNIVEATLNEGTILPDGAQFRPTEGLEQLERFTNPGHREFKDYSR